MMLEAPRMFGTELRRHRLEAGLSLTDLSRLVHYSKSHLSKVETGAKPASADLARQCDAALSSGGALIRLAASGHTSDSLRQLGEAGEVWILTLDTAGDNTFGVLGRRSPLVGGAATVAARASSSTSARQPADVPRAEIAEPALTSFLAIFDHLRQLGQWISPGLLIPQLATQVHALRSLAVRSTPAGRGAALVLAARFAEYAGWLTQEAGDDARALWWTDRAVELAAAGGDADMRAYAYVRRGLVTLYQHDAAGTVSLAQAAQAATADARILGLAAQREAQGHALAGDYDASMRAIDQARVWLEAADTRSGPVVGPSHVADLVTMAAGWCLFDLGRPEQAVEMLCGELDRIPAEALRARARYGTRLARAYAASGEPEAAAASVTPVLHVIGQIESATVRTELRHLARTLNRWHALPTLRDTMLQLIDSLNTGR